MNMLAFIKLEFITYYPESKLLFKGFEFQHVNIIGYKLYPVLGLIKIDFT